MSPIRHPVPEDFQEPRPRKCRVCGCTDDRACEGGCHWVEDDLCSTCAETLNQVVVTTQVYENGLVQAAHHFILPGGAFEGGADKLAKILVHMLKIEIPKFFRDRRTVNVVEEVRKKLAWPGKGAKG